MALQRALLSRNGVDQTDTIAIRTCHRNSTITLVENNPEIYHGRIAGNAVTWRMATCKHVTAYRSRQPERAKDLRLQRALLALWRKDSVSVKL